MEICHWVKNKSSQFTACCDQVAKFAGFDSPRNLLNKTDFDMIWKNRAKIYLAEEYIALTGKKYQQYQFQDTINGTIKIVVTKYPLLNKEENIIGTVGSAINISEHSILLNQSARVENNVIVFNDDLNNLSLTFNESIFLKYILSDLAIPKIARKLKLSQNALQSLIKSLKLKLQCSTIGDLIVFAVQHGLPYLCEKLPTQNTVTSTKIKYIINTNMGDIKLTKREAQCLFHLSKGKKGKMIAKSLQISPRTVEGFLTKIKDKLNCKTRIEILSNINDLDAVRYWDF